VFGPNNIAMVEINVTFLHGDCFLNPYLAGVSLN
jgi:hypothetical protein